MNPPIESALLFAQKHLGIKSRVFCWAYEILPFSSERGWLGLFSTNGMMSFNGAPSINTIFHESIHFHQWERGEDFTSSREESRMRFWPKLDFLGAGPQTCQIMEGVEWLAYRNDRLEIEAERVALEMEEKWNSVCFR